MQNIDLYNLHISGILHITNSKVKYGPKPVQSDALHFLFFMFVFPTAFNIFDRFFSLSFFPAPHFRSMWTVRSISFIVTLKNPLQAVKWCILTAANIQPISFFLLRLLKYSCLKSDPGSSNEAEPEDPRSDYPISGAEVPEVVKKLLAGAGCGWDSPGVH